MKLNNKAILTVCLLLVTMFLISGCAGEKTPYQINDENKYNVSVKYDANGGLFTTNTSVIVDSFNINDLQTNNAGQVEIALLSPDAEQRGKDAFTAYKNGYFLAGWYAERIETKDQQGNTVYTYSDMWDFSADMLKVHASGTYSSAEPVLTLYAAWVPMFEIELYDLDSGKYVDKISFNPNDTTEFTVPSWNQETGAIDMKDFPTRDGYTFNGVYYDEQGTESVTSATVKHSGSVNYENGSASNATMKLYVDWMEGEWFHIYTAEQFIKNAKVNGNYVIHADLDFADKIWPTAFVHGNFGGTIHGNGHTFKNVNAAQSNISKAYAGLFGQMKSTAQITDLTFENTVFSIEKGVRVSGSSFGLLAGLVDSNAAVTDVQFIDCVLQIDSGIALLTEDYSIGLICGMGDIPGMSAEGITCVVTGENPDSLNITVDGSSVRVEQVSE